jgi:hypothetical protein
MHTCVALAGGLLYTRLPTVYVHDDLCIHTVTVTVTGNLHVSHWQVVYCIHACQRFMCMTNYAYMCRIGRWFTVYTLASALVTGIILGTVEDSQSNSVSLTVVFFVNFLLLLIYQPMVSRARSNVGHASVSGHSTM